MLNRNKVQWTICAEVLWLTYGPLHEKTCLQGLLTTQVQTTSLRIRTVWLAPLLLAFWKVSYVIKLATGEIPPGRVVLWVTYLATDVCLTADPGVASLCMNYWLTACSSQPGKSVGRWTDRPAMTIAVDLGHKATKQTNKKQVKFQYSSWSL